MFNKAHNSSKYTLLWMMSLPSNTNNAPQGAQCCKIADSSLSVTPPSGNTIIVSGSVTSENCAASLNVPGNQASFSGRLELRKPFPASLVYTNTGGMQLANQNYEVSYNSATQSLSLVNVVVWLDGPD